MPKIVLIVGGGLFGCVAARMARNSGHRVYMFDDRRDWAASKAAGCLFAPRWAAGLGKEQYERAVYILDRLYGVTELPFVNTQTGLKFKLQHVPPSRILQEHRNQRSVVEVGDGWLVTDDGVKFKGTVLVAAGVWCRTLVTDMPLIKDICGSAQIYTGQLPNNKMKVWAPYRQLIGFNIGDDKVWAADGTAIKMDNYNCTRHDVSIDRTDAFCAPLQRAISFVGARPYIDGHKNGYFARVSTKTWVSTGGAKNGTLIAALQAKRFIEEAGL